MALTQVKSDGIADGAVTTNDLSNSGVTAGTYGSSSAIPAITVDAKGRITSATTSAIDSTSIANGTSNVSVAASGDITVTRAGSTAMTFTGNGALLPDSQEMRFGASADLRIYHDGGNSVIEDVGTGALVLKTNTSVNVVSGTELMAQFTPNGAADLYYDNSKKLATTSGGINVTGTVTCDGLVCEGEATVTASTGILNIKDSDSSGNATNNFIRGQNSNGAARWTVGQLVTNSETFFISNESNTDINFRTNGVTRAYLQNTGHFIPATTNAYDLGGSSYRWRNVYTNDLNLSNEGGANDVDGTWGSWTIQEGEDELFLLNRRNGKKYKFNLTEVN